MTDSVSLAPSPRKAVLRAEALARRDALELDDRLLWDEAIVGHVLALPVFTQGPVSAYWPMRSEADPPPILEALHERGLLLCLRPIAGKRMHFRRWAPWEPIVPGGFGTLVPAPEQPEVKPTILIVPLAAYDRRGYRIGYGKGYYDRAITELEPTLTIGIAYAAQEIAEVPAEAHDRRLDWVVTQDEAIRCG